MRRESSKKVEVGELNSWTGKFASLTLGKLVRGRIACARGESTGQGCAVPPSIQKLMSERGDASTAYEYEPNSKASLVRHRQASNPGFSKGVLREWGNCIKLL